jgi:ADP-ribose pyrophosphatase YjhB (NUDIX family)
MAINDHDNHFVGEIAQKAFIAQNGKVLLVKYPPNSPGAGMLDMPGGRLHKGEHAHEGVKREVREEVRAEIIIEGILGTGTFMNREGRFNYFVIYQASLEDPSQTFMPEAGEIEGVGWFDVKDFLSLPIIYEEYKEALKGFLV